MTPAIRIVLTLAIAIFTAGMGCEKSKVEISTTEGLETFRCPGVVNHCPRLAEITLEHPLTNVGVDIDDVRITPALFKFIRDSLATTSDWVAGHSGLGARLTQDDLRCLLGEPQGFSSREPHTDGIIYLSDTYSMSWDTSEEPWDDRSSHGLAGVPYFGIFYYETTGRLAFISTN